ncbi:hypothetical protein PVAND_007484 [Polypedilum vanderplanki]|uniref:GRAM domain-containing protein n=1 Tax=Polypedilum vanderplanki TaxID=319348 RepID=A0A9J6C6N7_POLVA|nr:hypothetical protein PVAND_007484 [Polypedilum vanderplanki]
MSVNTAHANGGVLIHAGETILLFSDNVTMEFSGQDGAIFKGSKQGRIYLTTHRIIFNSKNSKEPLQSFSSPFISMSDVELEQPVFGANYLKGKIRAQPNGNFTGEVKFKMSFKSGGCTDFGSALLRAASMAKRNANGMAPPPYEPPGSPWYAAPPPAYTPTPGSYGWLPQNSAFGQAPTDGVFMSDAPPPYPGINPIYQPPQNPQQFGNSAPYPGQQQQNFGNSAPYSSPSSSSAGYPTLPSQPFGFNAPSAPMSKEQEAAASAFYDPRNPNSAFVHNPQNFGQMPPSYDSLNQNDPNKKTQ